MSEAYVPDLVVDRAQAIENGRLSLDFFAAICIPEVYKFPFPVFFQAIWQLMTGALIKPIGKDRLALGIPRGFGKTMLLKLLVAWIVAYTDRKFILICCNTEPLAENFIADVMDILSNSNFIRLFGDYRLTLERDILLQKKFFFRGRPVIIAGIGQGSSPRGLNIKYVRPDVIIQDDMQSREQAESPVESVKNISWMIGTLMKTNDNNRCLHLFIGNMYPFQGSILKKLKTNPAWVSLVTGAILEDGQSLWPELRSIDDILEELENDESLGHPEIFYSEVMNDDEAGSRAGIDFSKINVYQPDSAKPIDYHSGFVIIDPSLGKKRSDDVAVGACTIYDTEPVLEDAVLGKFDPGKTITEALKLCFKYGLKAVVVEAHGYQESLCYWFSIKLAQLGLSNQITILTINRSTSKNADIVAMLKQLTAQKDRLFITQRVRSLVTHQITYFDPLKTNNKDDLLDIMAYFRKVMAQHAGAIMRPLDMMYEEVEATFSDDLELDF